MVLSGVTSRAGATPVGLTADQPVLPGFAEGPEELTGHAGFPPGPSAALLTQPPHCWMSLTIRRNRHVSRCLTTVCLTTVLSGQLHSD